MIGPDTGLRAALEAVAASLAAAGIEEPRLEARQLMMAALECTLSHLVLNERVPLGPASASVNALLTRRAAREPLSRILGQREFAGFTFALGPETLDPRPDTEVLVDLARAALAPLAAPRVLDLGTGSGAVLLAVLAQLPQASGVGVDISTATLAVARANATALGLTARATFAAGDLFAPLAPQARFDAILSNPPYIPAGEIETLDPEVRLFDPRRALDGGADGLEFYRRIATGAANHLVAGGLLAVEVGAGQAEAVSALFVEAGLRRLEGREDTAGILRVVAARRP